MRIKKRILSAALLLLAVSAIAFAGRFFGAPGKNYRPSLPGAMDEMKKLVARWNRDSAIQAYGSIKLYSDDKPGLLKEEQRFSFWKNGLQFYSNLGGQETVCDGKLAVQLDTINKLIIVTRLPGSMGNMAGNLMPVEQLFSDSAAFRLTGTVSEDNGTRKILLKNEATPEIKSSTVSYDPASYMVEEYEIRWWKHQAVAAMDTSAKGNVWLTKIDYHFVQPAAVDIPAKLDALVSIKKDGLQPGEKYKDYRLVY